MRRLVDRLDVERVPYVRDDDVFARVVHERVPVETRRLRHGQFGSCGAYIVLAVVSDRLGQLRDAACAQKRPEPIAFLSDEPS